MRKQYSKKIVYAVVVVVAAAIDIAVGVRFCSVRAVWISTVWSFQSQY